MNSARKLSAVAVVALLIVPMMLMFSGVLIGVDPVEAVDDGAREITYHDPVSDEKVTLTYYGTAVAEYNPEYWSNQTVVGQINSESLEAWVGPEVDYSNIPISVTINLSWDIAFGLNNKTTVVFPNGTVTEPSKDISINKDSSQVDSSQVTIDRYHNFDINKPNSGTVHVNYAGISGLIVNKVFGGWTTQKNGGTPYSPGEEIPADVTDLYVKWIEPDLFFKGLDVGDSKNATYVASENVTPYCPYDERNSSSRAENPSSNSYSKIYSVNGNISGTLSEGTYRSAEAINGPTNNVDWSGSISTSESEIDSNYGPVLIDNINLIGTENSGNSHGSDQALYANGKTLIIGTGVTCGLTSQGKGVQINGGSKNGESISNTDVRIFSGTYSTIFGGSNTGTITGTTNVTILGGTITDTVYGGSRGTQDNPLDGGVTNTRVLVVGGEIFDSSNEKYKFNQNYQTIVGGSRFSGDVVSTDVTISHLGKTYAVQGGGRHGANTHVDNANVTISGKAEVYYLVCGSVTDGNDSNSDAAVESSTVTIRHAAEIGSKSSTEGGVFAGGWDTYYDCVYPSTEKTKLVIEGGTIWGSAYGGGFRGTVGVGNTADDTVTIEISGGTVKGSVYGGGKGGPDPVEIAMEASKNNSTGIAQIKGNVSISMTGGIVENSVYGGGEGVEKQSGRGGHDDVAMVKGNIDIDISGGTVNRSVYGGGQGKDSNSSIASVEGNVSISISRTVGSTNDSVGFVYGGGEYSKISGTTLSIVLNSALVNNSVYGGGKGLASKSNLGSVSMSEDLSIAVQNTTVTGSVYGGGEFGKTSAASSSMTISGSNTGSVYGGGKGDASNSDSGVYSLNGNLVIAVQNGSGTGSIYGGGEFGNTIAHSLSITIEDSEVKSSVYGGGQGQSGINTAGKMNISNESEIVITNSTVSGDVYGGGAYGLFESKTLNMDLLGESTRITGSVYGGGLGTEKVLSTVVEDRTIVINGPSIGGSVYGGSRNGDDNYLESGNPYQTCDTRIYILSGNIASGSSGNVYGGAYKGRSKMNAGIYIGSAVPEQYGTAETRSFSINSIYGGASVGEVTADFSTSTRLLFGDTTIHIGGEGYVGRITGDVFGAGDFCEIDGTSEIVFEHFSQDGSMLSIQKANSVELIDTELVLDGSVDGNTTSGSSKLSINDVGSLTLDGDATAEGRSGLVLNAQVSTLSRYASVHTGEITSGDSYQTGLLNYIRINGGKMFTVLGPNNDGTGVSGTATSGVTLFLRDETNSYYGALAISAPSVDFSAEFVLQDGTVASRTTYQYATGVIVTVWYVAGAFTVDETMTIVSGRGTMSKDIGIPKMASNSEIQYVGHYTSMNSEGSLNVVEEIGEEGSDATDFVVLLGNGGSGLQYGNGGLNLAIATSGTEFTGSGASINVSVTTDTTFNKTGYAGTIHIHMVEAVGGVIIGTFDMEIAVYLRIPQPEENPYTIEQDILVKDISDGKHRGETDVYLPVLDNGTVGTYSIVSVSDIPTYSDTSGKLSMSLAPTQMNESGWRSEIWTEQVLEEKTYDQILGEGGLYSPVLHFEFECPGHDPKDTATEWKSITIVFKVVWSDSEGSHEQTYNVILTPKHASIISMSFYDRWLVINGESVTWYYPVSNDDGDVVSNTNPEGRIPSFTISLQFGDSLMGLGVLIDVNKLTSYNEWTDYIDAFQSCLYSENGHVVTGYSADDSAFDNVVDKGSYRFVPLYSENEDDLLDIYQEQKSRINGFDTGADYIENVRWFDNPEGPAQFNFYSQVTDDGLSLYAGYGIILSFKPEFTESIDWAEPMISPDSTFRANLSDPVILNDLRESLRVTTGFEIEGFYDSEGNRINEDVGRLILQDTTITVKLEALEYKLNITVTDGNNTLYEDGNPVDGADISVSIRCDSSTLHFGSAVDVVITYTGGQQYRILDASGTYGNFTLEDFTFTQAAGNGSSICGFQMPSGDMDLTIILSKGYTITVTLPESDPSTDDNGRFAISAAESIITVSTGSGDDFVQLDIGLNPDHDIPLTLPGDYDSREITVTLTDATGASVTIEDGKLKLTEISGDVSVGLVINIEWGLEFKGEGYTVTRGDQTLTSAVSTVHTGDVLVLKTNPGYLFDKIPGYVGVDRTNSTDTETTIYFVVNGTDDVSFNGSATRYQYQLTVNVVFGGPAISGLPDGALTIDETEYTKLTLEDNVATITVLLDRDDHTLSISYEGYIDNSMDVAVTSEMAVTIHAVPRLADETGPQTDPAHYSLWYRQGSADGTHDVTGLGNVSGTFSTYGMIVTIGDSEITLKGFSAVVGTVVFDIGGGSTLAITVIPNAVSAGGNQTV